MQRVRLLLGAVLLGVSLWLGAVLLTGCSYRDEGNAVREGGAGGTATTSTGGPGDVSVLQDCCVKGVHAPFEGFDYFIISTKDDAKDEAPTCEALGLEPGFTAVADPIVPQSTCPTCECSPASCALPE